MTTLSLQQRKDWWMTLYAIQSFNFSLQACKDLLKLRDLRDSTHPSLVIAIHGFYGRPFKAQRGVSTKEKMCIDPKVVPLEFSSMHEFLIDFRDKVLLHNDAEELAAMGEPINRVRLRVTQSGWEFDTAAHFRHPIETYRTVPHLLDVLIKHFTSEHERMKQEFSSLLPQTPGNYFLNVSEGSPFLPLTDIPEIISFKGRQIDA